MSGSKIFTPYKAVGLVSNDIPLVVRYIRRRKENLIVTSIGNCFHTYGANKLGVLSVSNPHGGRIICLSADAYHVYTACKNVIYAWRRGTELKHTYEGHETDVKLILPLGPHLVAVDLGNILRVWDIKMESVYLEMEFPESFIISSVVHPATYLNKILIGCKQGKLQLWNLKTSKLVYTFAGWDSAVLMLEQAPAQDVVAIGLSNGTIILHNLKYNETVMQFKQDWGIVTGISFRTDGPPVMVTGSEQGHIAIWDLNERRLASQIYDAHTNGVTGLQCLTNEPLLVTSSSDNTLKMWIFDMPDGGARLLKKRDGHSAPPLTVKFHDALGKSLLSAGEDSTIRMFCTATDIQSQSFGQASVNRKSAKRNKGMQEKLKLPAIIGFTSEVAQEKAWDNIVAIHRSRAVATTWSTNSQKMGEHKLLHKRFFDRSLKQAEATVVTLTVCGNFVIIGYNTGHMDKYNVQSGLLRGTFGETTAHIDAVRGIVCDGMNQWVVSGGSDSELHWWRLKDCVGIKKLILGAGVSCMEIHRDSGLFAIALDDWSINIVDIDTKCVVRHLFGHSNKVVGLSFSPNSQWLVSCSLDKTIRTWDLPSGSCIDRFAVEALPSSMAMSPIGDFLATTHTNHLGIYLWANRACFTHIALHPLVDEVEPQLMALPSTSANNSLPVKEGEEEMELTEFVEEQDDEYLSPDQISLELITLAGLPTSRWLNLLNLDVIKRKNKPTEPPKMPKAAPFFLPTVTGLNVQFAMAAPEGKDESKSKIGHQVSFEVVTPFGAELKKSFTCGNFEKPLQMLMEMGPSAIEVELRGLDPDVGGSEDLMMAFLLMIQSTLQNKCHYEAAQGFLGLFLKLHADIIVENEKLNELLEKLSHMNLQSWHDLRECFHQSLSIVSYLKNAAIMNY